MEIELTKDSRKTLKRIYEMYCNRRDAGQSKSSARYFADPMWGGGPTIDGMDDARDELRNAKLIKTDITGGFELTDRAIIFMENFTKDSILKWIDVGTKFIP